MWKITLSINVGACRYWYGALHSTTTAKATRTAKKQKILWEKQQLYTCGTLCCTFLWHHCTTVRWNSLKRSFMEDVNTRLQISLSKLGGSPKKSSSRKFNYIHSPTLHIHVMAYRQLSKQNIHWPVWHAVSRAQASWEITWLFKFTADRSLVFNWSQAQVPWFSKWKSSTSRFLRSGKLFYSRSISLQWLQVPKFFLDVSCKFIKGSFAFSPG